jgi:hypothetical protein
MHSVEELNSAEFSTILMMSTFKMFFKRAPETKHLLAYMFKEVMTNTTDTDLKQKAVFMYRLLQNDINLAKKIADETFNEFEDFFETKNDEVQERLFQEFNSLSVVYQKPSERFLKESVLK